MPETVYPTVRFADVAEVAASLVDPLDPEFADLPHVGGENMVSGSLNLRNVHTAREDNVRSAKYLFSPGEVLYSKIRPYLRKAAEVEFVGLCSADIYPIRPDPERLDPGYLNWLLLSEPFTKYAVDKSGRARMPKINRRALFNWEFPLPTLSEQRQVASHLTAQSREVDSARLSASKQLSLARALTPSYLADAFDGDEAAAWPVVRIGDVLTRRTEIVHPKNHPSGPATFVGLEHIDKGTGIRLGSEPIEKDDLTGRRAQFYEGDIVYGYLRPYLNKVWVAEFEGLCSVDQYVYTYDSDRVDPEFMAAFMRSPVFLRRAPVGNSPGQLPRIRSGEVDAVEVGLPPLPVQRLVAEDLRQRRAEVQEILDALQTQLDEIDALPGALLREAFAGQL